MRNHDIDRYEVMNRLDPAADSEHIENITEEIDHGTFDGKEDYRKIVEMLRRFERKSDRDWDNDIRTEEGGFADRLVQETGRDADGGRDLPSGDRDNAGGIKQNFSTNDAAEQRFSFNDDVQEDFIEQAIDMEKRQKKQEEELQQVKARQATDELGEQKASR